jgi:hypothetical protein
MELLTQPYTSPQKQNDKNIINSNNKNEELGGLIFFNNLSQGIHLLL